VSTLCMQGEIELMLWLHCYWKRIPHSINVPFTKSMECKGHTYNCVI